MSDFFTSVPHQNVPHSLSFGQPLKPWEIKGGHINPSPGQNINRCHATDDLQTGRWFYYGSPILHEIQSCSADILSSFQSSRESPETGKEKQLWWAGRLQRDKEGWGGWKDISRSFVSVALHGFITGRTMSVLTVNLHCSKETQQRSTAFLKYSRFLQKSIMGDSLLV